MANVVQLLKEEITRLARKEVRSGTAAFRADNSKLKKSNVDLKRRVAGLEKDCRRLLAAEKRRLAEAPRIAPEKVRKARITAKGMRSLRRKLGLSASQFAALLGVSAQIVQVWEKKEGALNVRETTRAAVLSIRGIGAREAKARLEEIAQKAPARKAKPAKRKGKKGAE